MVTNNATNTSNPISVTQGGTGVATNTTAYALLAAGTTATGAQQSLSSAGTSGQVLVSGGSSSLPSWANAGRMTLLQSQDASNSASLNFTTGISSTYPVYWISYSNMVPATNGRSLILKISVDGGANYLATNYVAGAFGAAYNSASAGNANSTTFFPLGFTVDNTASIGISGNVYLYGSQTANNKMITGTFSLISGTLTYLGTLGGRQTTGSSVNALQVLYDSGNITSGTVALYGIN